MRKLFLQIMVSLDGYIEGPNGELDWHRADEEFEEYVNQTLRSIDGMLLGKKIYDVFFNYWPDVFKEFEGSENPPPHFETACLLQELPKYVVSTTLEKPGWNNSHLIKDNIRNEIKKLKEQPGRDIALFGGAGLAASLMEMNLIDEYRLIVNPVILGGGTPLFREGQKKNEMTLTDTKRFKSGAIMLVYE